jgi:hypothetical protein
LSEAKKHNTIALDSLVKAAIFGSFFKQRGVQCCRCAAMPTPFDVKGTITPKIALIIIAIVVTGLVLAFTPLSVIAYVLLAIAAIVYMIANIRTLVQQLR